MAAWMAAPIGPSSTRRMDVRRSRCLFLGGTRNVLNEVGDLVRHLLDLVEGRARVFEGTVAPLTVLDAAALFSLQLEGDEACRAFATAFRCLARLVAITSPRDAACLAAA